MVCVCDKYWYFVYVIIYLWKNRPQLNIHFNLCEMHEARFRRMFKIHYTRPSPNQFVNCFLRELLSSRQSILRHGIHISAQWVKFITRNHHCDDALSICQLCFLQELTSITPSSAAMHVAFTAYCIAYLNHPLTFLAPS